MKPTIAPRGTPRSEQIAHPGIWIKGRFKEKPCRGCETVFEPMAPSNLYCSEVCRVQAFTNNYYRNAYGITCDEWEALYKTQGGVCAICLQEGFTMKESHVAKLMVDHCHTTGRVRGLLCHNCNRALGLLKDSTENLTRAIAYLAVSN